MLNEALKNALNKALNRALWVALNRAFNRNWIQPWRNWSLKAFNRALNRALNRAKRSEGSEGKLRDWRLPKGVKGWVEQREQRVWGGAKGGKLSEVEWNEWKGFAAYIHGPFTNSQPICRFLAHLWIHSPFADLQPGCTADEGSPGGPTSHLQV